jgi:hypothetical protein
MVSSRGIPSATGIPAKQSLSARHIRKVGEECPLIADWPTILPRLGPSRLEKLGAKGTPTPGRGKTAGAAKAKPPKSPSEVNHPTRRRRLNLKLDRRIPPPKDRSPAGRHLQASGRSSLSRGLYPTTHRGYTHRKQAHAR